MTQKRAPKKKPSRLPTSLKNLLKREDEGAYEEYYHQQATKAVRKLLVEELTKRIESNVLASEKKDKYELPSWAELQADSIGYRRAMRELIKLLTKE